MRAVHLQTEYLTEPVGIDIVKPRFYWNCTGGISQSAYQITVKKEEEVLWDSGKVQSSSMTHILCILSKRTFSTGHLVDSYSVPDSVSSSSGYSVSK